MKSEDRNKEELTELTRRLLVVNQQLATAIKAQMPMPALLEMYSQSNQLIDQIVAIKKKEATANL